MVVHLIMQISSCPIISCPIRNNLRTFFLFFGEMLKVVAMLFWEVLIY